MTQSLESARLKEVVSLRNVSVDYPGHCLALSEVTVSIMSGEFIFIVGPSGAGKSTLLKLLTRQETATEGEVVVNGKNLGQLSARDVPTIRRDIGVVFQDFGLLPDRTVYENVAFAMRVVGTSRREVRSRIPEALEMVGIAHRPDAFPHQLSGGEQQRVAIARALANSPEILIADEPTGNLDPETSLGIVELLHDINEKGATVLVATHDVAIVDQRARRVLAFAGGRLVRDEACGRYERMEEETTGK